MNQSNFDIYHIKMNHQPQAFKTTSKSHWN